MGATAARSLLGRSVVVKASRGQLLSSPAGDVIVTIHPSLILRIPDAEEKKREFRAFVTDLKLCKTLLSRVSGRVRSREKSVSEQERRL